MVRGYKYEGGGGEGGCSRIIGVVVTIISAKQDPLTFLCVTAAERNLIGFYTT